MDKHADLRALLARINGEDTDDCFDAYLEWRKAFDVEHCKAMLAERDGLRMALSDAAMSLETIAEQSGRDEGMTAFSQVRGYANSRASVARIALKST